MKLEFLTLTTGQSKGFERKDIPNSVVMAVQMMLRQGGTLTDGWSVEILRYTPEEAVFDLFLDDDRVTHCWLCIASTAADRMWRAATVDGFLPIVLADKQPDTVPWLAVGMARDIINVAEQRPARMLEAAQAELAVSWALIEQACQAQ